MILNLSKRILFPLLLVFLLASANHTIAQEKRLKVVCSTTQVTDFVRNVVGDRCEVIGILREGVDPHLYEVKPADASLVASADICFKNGWNLEGKDWIGTLAKNSGKKCVSCVEGVEPRMLEEDGKKVQDPHAWFSPGNAVVYVRNIAKAMIEVDPEGKYEYEARASLYIRELQTLDGWIKSQVNLIPANKRTLVTNHDAFGYFCRRYGFKNVAPASWSTGEEVGAATTKQLRDSVIEAIRKEGVKAIFIETSVDPRVVQQIAKESGAKISGNLYADAMGAKGTAGESYIGMMRENVLQIVGGLKE